MKRNRTVSIIGITLALMIHATTPGFARGDDAVFSDVTSENPHFQAIDYLYRHHIVEGYSDHSFQPGKLVNRAEAIKLILLGAGIFVPDIRQQEIFPDVFADSWYGKYALKAKNLNVVKGDDGTGFFRPGDTVNLAEVLKMVLLSSEIHPGPVKKNPYPDVDKDAWFAPYFAYAKSHQLLEGEERKPIHPDQSVNRGLLAEIIYRLRVKPEASVNTYASFYGKGFDGRGTASGEKFDQNKFTAAHRTYPFNTVLKVTNTDNGKSVIVKVNDRGPYGSKNRVIDLSQAAFEAIAPLSNGIIPVRLEEVPAETSPPAEDNADSKVLQADITQNVGTPCSLNNSTVTLFDPNAFESIQLKNPLPDRFLVNEITKIEGQVVASAQKVNLFLVDDGKVQTVFQSGVTQGHFALNVHFPHTGHFRLGMITGDEGKSIVKDIDVVESACLKEEVDETLNPISSIQLEVVNGDSRVSWNPGTYNVFKLSLRQGALLKSYVIFHGEEWVPPYADFKAFKEGAVELIMRGSMTSGPALLSAQKIRWGQPYSQEFKVTLHRDYKVDNDKIELLSVSPFSAVRNALEISVRPKVNLRENAALISPEGSVKEFSLHAENLMSKLNEKSIAFFPGGSYTLKGTYNVTDIGTHILEINDLEGLAAINIPVYTRNQFPLLPNLNDLTARTVEDLGSDVNGLRQKMLTLINADRHTAQLQPVVLDQSLNNLAQARADDMIQKKYFGHWNPQGLGAEDMKSGFAITTTISENLAKEVNLEFAEYGFMGSAIHRANVLGSDWTRAGVGIKKTEDGTYLFVQIFAPDPISLNNIGALRSKLLEALNQKRTMPLGSSDPLNDLAQDWSQRMAQEDFFGWTDPQGNALSSYVRQVETKKMFGTFIVANSTFSSAMEQILQNTQMKEESWHVLGIGIAQDRVGIVKITLIYTE